MDRASSEFLPSYPLRPQLDAFCGIKHTQKIDFGQDFAPDFTELTAY